MPASDVLYSVAVLAGRTQRVPRRVFEAGIFIVVAALLIVMSYLARGEDATTPPPAGDPQDYDNIALQLLHGRGFAIDYTDAEWRRSYEQHSQEGDFDQILARKNPHGRVTDRAPLLPFALAITYRLFGRGFLAWRVIAAILVAGGIALICDVAWRAFGSSVTLIAASLMFLSATYIRYVAYWGFMTEPLAIALISVIVWLLSIITRRNAMRIAVACGVAFALLCLTRTFYLTWVPFLPVLLWWSAVRAGVERRDAMRAAVVFSAITVAMQLPWWMRNCLVAGAFRPFVIEMMSVVTTGAGFVAPVFWLAMGAPLVLRRRWNFIGREVAAILIVPVVLSFGSIATSPALSWRMLVPVEPILTVLVALTIASVIFSDRAIAAEAG